VATPDEKHDILGCCLAERQPPNGGLNGRPEKLEDVRPSPLSSPLTLSNIASIVGYTVVTTVVLHLLRNAELDEADTVAVVEGYVSSRERTI
jgi:hypothetical protein